jgi:tRNA-2-methylthio-N6-dimethylallyladenosine synthase
MKNNTPNINNARMRRSKPQILKNVFKINNELKTIGLNKKYFIRTYGCQSNTRDSEIISGILEMMGYTKTNDPVNSDILILNTCAIRENAELKVFGEIGFLKQISDANPNFLFGVCGCMAQEESVVKKIIDKISHINFVFGTHNIYELPHIIDEAIKTKTQVIKVYSKEGDIIEELPTTRDSKIKAFVNVMYGCDNFCTYCIVPYTRGKIRSRDKQDILNEIVDLKNKGYKEVTLLGQNVNSYGIDKNDGYKFANLLEDVCKTNIDRVRFTTSNP